jgi:glycosyltransferase involved in cell wall biosynthesis
MSRTFLILNNVLGIERPNGRVMVAGRLVSGALELMKHWSGEVEVAVEPAPQSELEANQDRALGGDNVEVGPSDLPFRLRVLPFDSQAMKQLLGTITAGMGGLNYRQTHISRWAKSAGVPYIYNTEYTLKTYLQILFAEQADPLKRMRSSVWHTMVEAKQRAAIILCDGLQCNGVPTYLAYRSLCPSTILFFDGRTTEQMLVPPEVLEQRLSHLLGGNKLRLGFSGRLNKMKGADELIGVAQRLKERGLDFSLKIWGGGVLAEEMKAEIQRLDLSGTVEMMGFIPFEELVRKMQREIDLFLCCHPQGDPAGAYMEAFANGTPVVGYANEALGGLLEMMPCGLAVPIRDREALAERIIRLAQDREKIARWSKEAVNHAAQHTFDKSFRRRMEHIDQVIALHQRKLRAG